MSVWTVQIAAGDDELVEAGMLATESGALVALSEEGLMVRAWAPGEWRTVRGHHGADGLAAGRADGKTKVLIGLPRG